eukprot:7344849-Prymnesium_polylepis.1
MNSSGVDHPGAAPVDDKPPADETGVVVEGDAKHPACVVVSGKLRMLRSNHDPIGAPVRRAAAAAGGVSTTGSFCKRTSSMHQSG